MIKEESIKARLKLSKEVYDRFPEESRSYLDKLANQIYLNGVTEGIRLSRQWIPVKEELPPGGTECFVKTENHGVIKAWYSAGNQWIHDAINDKRYRLCDVTHWRVIG